MIEKLIEKENIETRKKSCIMIIFKLRAKFAVPVHRVVRAVEFKMATGCKFLSLAASSKIGLYRYVTRTNVSFFDPSPNDQRTEHSCA